LKVEKKANDKWIEDLEEYIVYFGSKGAVITLNEDSKMNIRFLNDLCSGKLEGILQPYYLKMSESVESYEDTQQYGYPLIVHKHKIITDDGETLPHNYPIAFLYPRDFRFVEEEERESDGVIDEYDVISSCYQDDNVMDFLKKYIHRITNSIREIEVTSQKVRVTHKNFGTKPPECDSSILHETQDAATGHSRE